MRTIGSRTTCFLVSAVFAVLVAAPSAAAQAVDDQYLEVVPTPGGPSEPLGDVPGTGTGSPSPGAGTGDGTAALSAEARKRLRAGASKEEAAKLEDLASSPELGAPVGSLQGGDGGAVASVVPESGRAAALVAAMVAIAAAAIAGAAVRRRRRPA